MTSGSSSLHYKFGYDVAHRYVNFDGIHISLDELKAAVAKRENINLDYVDLTFKNADTKRMYEGTCFIPRNSSILVQRTPRSKPIRMPKIGNSEISGSSQLKTPKSLNAGHVNEDAFTNMSEEDRIKHVMLSSTHKYSPSNYNRTHQQNTTNVSPFFRCKRCLTYGHHPKQCHLPYVRKVACVPNHNGDSPNIMNVTEISNEKMLEEAVDISYGVLPESVDQYEKLLNTAPIFSESEEEDEEPSTNKPEAHAQPAENDTKPESPVVISTVELDKPLVILPTVNLSEMLANKGKQSYVPSPEPIANYSQPASIIQIIPVMDYSKSPNFKSQDFSQFPPTISPVAPKTDALPSPTSDGFHVPLSKPRISTGTNYDEKDEEAINNAWEKLIVGDDTLSLETLFESRTSYVAKKEDEEKNGKEHRIKRKSKSQDHQRRRDERRSRSPHKSRRESSKKRESSSSRKRSNEREDRHRTAERRSSDYRDKNETKEYGKKKEMERKEERRRSDEQKYIRSRDLERQRKCDEDEKKVIKVEQEEKKVVKMVPKLPYESPKRNEEDVIDKHNVKKVSSNEKSEKRRSSSKRGKTDPDESGPSHQELKQELPEKEKIKEPEKCRDNGKEKKKKKEKDGKEKSEKMKSRKKDKSKDTVECEKEKKKSKSEEKKKRKTVSDQSDEEEEKRMKKRHKEKKHKKDRKRENVGDDVGDDQRKRSKI